MHIHEYQAKHILKNYNIAIPKSKIINNVKQCKNVIQELAGNVWVAKAQVHAGSRGKGGGVIVCKSLKEVESACNKLLNTKLITPQTDDNGLIINKILIEEGLEINIELYLALSIDREQQKIVLISSTEGGVDIEEVAENNPEKIFKYQIDISANLDKKKIDKIAKKLNVDCKKFNQIVLNLYNIFMQNDVSLIEINPLIVNNNQLLPLDCKMEFDDNALFKHKNILELRDISQENSKEIEASNCGLNYIALNGNIGCMVNGAGLSMATMDIIKHFGGEPANFLDVGGTTTSERVAKALEIITHDDKVKVVLVNIFGGIVRCDLIAEGILQAIEKVQLKIPLVVRLEGTNAKAGLNILNKSTANIISENNLDLATKKAVEIAQ